jgi:2-octaprenylphenol hydroxylase
MSEHRDFVIMGAGVIGLTAALALHQRGYSVVLLEANAIHTPSSTRVYALNLASQQLFQTLGVWHPISSHATAYERMYVWDAQSHAKIEFDARMLARDQLGVILEEQHLKSALMQQITACAIPILAPWQTTALDVLEDKIIVRNQQQSIQADFLLIADGARSTTRELLRIPMTHWPYQQRAIVATVAVEKPHAQTAYQIFRPQGPLAFLPLADPHHCSIVWSTALPHVESLMALSEEAFAQELAQAFEHRLGKVTILSERHSFPLQMQHVQQYAGTRWAIMGDAAHTIHPLAGLGLNLGLADLSALLSLIDKPFKTTLTRRQLQMYQRQRKYALWQTILFLQGIHRLFTQTLPPIQFMRRMGLKICDRLPLLKRAVIEHAAGLSRSSP